MCLSLERLECLAAAQSRQRAAFLLEIGQVFSLAFSRGHPWQRKQRDLIARASTPSPSGRELG